MAQNGENLLVPACILASFPGDGHQPFKLHSWWLQNEILQQFVTVHACAIRTRDAESACGPIFYLEEGGRSVKTTSRE